jgi:5-methylcytosine-specific restriction protein B
MAGWQTGLSDSIRQHVLDKYVAPAREKGALSITLRSGDIHKQLSLSNRLPQVCSAIDARRFEIEANVRLVDRQGPPVSPGVVWRFELIPIEDDVYELVH